VRVIVSFVDAQEADNRISDLSPTKLAKDGGASTDIVQGSVG
jgi:hypothetical protein